MGVIDLPSSGVIKLVLTSFRGAQVKDIITENGDLEKCVCIPLDRNGLVEGKTGKVNVYAFVNKTRNSNMHGWTHYLKQKVSPIFVKKINELGYEVPYIGNMKPKNYIIHKGNYQNTIKPTFVKAEDYE